MPINLDIAFSTIDEHWSPRIAAELNGQHVKLAKFKGEFVWHKHDDADEMFLVHKGELIMEFRDRRVSVREGEFIVVPRGVEHCPVAPDEVECILFEPAGTLNTGDTPSEKTVIKPKQLGEA